MGCGQCAGPLTELARGAACPLGAFHIRNDFGECAYGGTPPPAGQPRAPVLSWLVVHALGVAQLDLTVDASPAFGFNVSFHTLARLRGHVRIANAGESQLQPGR